MKWSKTKVIAVILISIYAMVMMLSAVVLGSDLPSWLIILNLLAGLVLLLSIKWSVCLYIGLGAFLLISILNGQALAGENTVSHLLVRFVFSVGLIVLYRLGHKKRNTNFNNE